MNFATSAWGYLKRLTTVKLRPNLFQFSIPAEEDRRRILSRGPWIIDSQLLILSNQTKSTEEDEGAFRYASMWGQVWNLPIHWVSREVGRKIGRIFKEIKEMIIPQNEGKEGKHLKLLVLIDISRPLLRGTTVKMNGW